MVVGGFGNFRWKVKNYVFSFFVFFFPEFATKPKVNFFKQINKGKFTFSLLHLLKIMF